MCSCECIKLETAAQPHSNAKTKMKTKRAIAHTHTTKTLLNCASFLFAIVAVFAKFSAKKNTKQKIVHDV